MLGLNFSNVNSAQLWYELTCQSGHCSLGWVWWADGRKSGQRAGNAWTRSPSECRHPRVCRNETLDRRPGQLVHIDCVWTARRLHDSTWCALGSVSTGPPIKVLLLDRAQIPICCCFHFLFIIFNLFIFLTKFLIRFRDLIVERREEIEMILKQNLK